MPVFLPMHTALAAAGVSRRVHLSSPYLLFYPLSSWKENQFPFFHSPLVHIKWIIVISYTILSLLACYARHKTGVGTQSPFCWQRSHWDMVFFPVTQTLRFFSVINLSSFKVHGGAEVAASRGWAPRSSSSVISFLLCPIHTQHSNLGLPLSERREIPRFAAARAGSKGVFCKRQLTKPSLLHKNLFQQSSAFTFSK